MNIHRYGNIDNAVGGHESFKLFHFKLEIAKFLLKKPRIQPSQLGSANSISDVNESDEANELPPKKVRESASTVTQLIQYDGLDHWPMFVSAINNIRCKNILEMFKIQCASVSSFKQKLFYSLSY